MHSAVIVFPGSTGERDLARALQSFSGRAPAMIWHKETSLPAGIDLVALPGGASFGDYLRPGAIAARAPIMEAVAGYAARGGLVLGLGNGFQVLTEAGMLPGVLMLNAGSRFTARDVHLRVTGSDTPFTSAYPSNAVIRLPIAHHAGNFHGSESVLAELRDEDRIAFRYCRPDGGQGGNPNGSADDIAGILSANRRVLGMMPRPERRADPALGGMEGAGVFESLMQAVATA